MSFDLIVFSKIFIKKIDLKKSIFLFYYFSWHSKGIIFYDSSWHCHCFDSSFNIVSDYYSDFSFFCINKISFDFYFYVFIVVPQVCCDKPTSNIYIVSDNRISDITQVGNIYFISKSRIFDFYCISDFTIFSNHSLSSQISVWSD